MSGASVWPAAIALGMMGVGIGVQGAPVQTAAVEAVPDTATGAAAGIYSTSRYLGSVVGSTVLAVVFATNHDPNDRERFVALFAGLTLVAAVGIAVNTRGVRREA